MRFIHRLILTWFLISLQSVSFFAQENMADSLKTVLKSAKHDTVRCRILNVLIEEEQDPKVWVLYNDELILICKTNLEKARAGSSEYKIYKKYLAGALNNSGFLNNISGNVARALDDFQQSLKASEDIDDQENMSTALKNLGRVYQYQGNIPKALDCLLRSLKIHEKKNDKVGSAICLTLIGAVYYERREVPKALEYFSSSLKIMEEVGDKKGIANTLNYLGILYKNEGDPDCHLSKEECRKNGLTKALDFFSRAFMIQSEIGDKYGQAASLNSIGLTYKIQGDPACSGSSEECIRAGTAKAIEYCNKSLKLLEEIGHKDGVAIALNNIGELYIKQEQYDKALNYCMRSFKMSQEMGYPENIAMSALDLSKIYRVKGDYQKALEYKELFVKMKDSINSETNRKASIRAQLKYDYEKQAAADSVLHAKSSEIKNAEIARQNSEIKVKRNQQYALYGGLALVLVFSGFIFNRFKITQRQKKIIEKQKKEVELQKHLLEDKQKEILDSIHYARRIQNALITSDKYFVKNFERLRKNN